MARFFGMGAALAGALLLAWPALAQEPAAPPPELDLGWALAKTVGGLGLVLALMWGLLWLMRRFAPNAGGGGAGFRLVGRLSLGPRKWLGLVELGGRLLVLGVSDQGVSLLETIDDPEEVARLTQNRQSFTAALQKARGGRAEDKP